MTLSKSLYTRGIQCSKSLWLKKYSAETMVNVHQKLREVIG
jgi:hypothetical protein